METIGLSKDLVNEFKDEVPVAGESPNSPSMGHKASYPEGSWYWLGIPEVTTPKVNWGIWTESI